MKNTIITLGVGFLIGRYIYINRDKKEAHRKEAQIKRRIIATLEDLGLSKREIKEQSNTIFKR
ncbi:hypothetical protein [Aquimarina megaterium]|uniref:hypothetical protein n=1 Tax=Aquimarina megaterium TaxID=1443666 RepID=UPI000470FAC9|nr:hypothetical protein [Aquimarina megaterium]